jgi:nucleoside-diphosphate-sugar epimerase
MRGRVLVTGASGFVGRATVAALRDRGYEVHGVAREPAAAVEVDQWHTADLLDPATVAPLVREASPSHLLHLAWTTGHGAFWSDPANRDWIAATRRLAEAFSAAGGVRMVMSGSCAQYDWTGDVTPFSETTTPRHPATVYGQAKNEAMDLVEEAGSSHATALLFFPYGPFEATERLVPSVTRRLLAEENAPLTAGTQVRDFIHVADCGAALAALVDSEVTGPVNVGSGQGTTVLEVATTIGRIIGRENLLRVGAIRSDDGWSVVAAIDRLRDEVGFVPRYELEAGLRDAVDWWAQRTRRR